MFPKNIAGFHRGQRTDNEPSHPGMGFTVAYAAADAKATIYLYNRGQSDIGTGPTGQAVLQEFQRATEEVLALAQIADSSPVRLRGRYVTGNPATGPEFLCAEFLMEGDQPHLSYLYLTGHGGKFLKARVTTDTSDPATNIARQFADDLAEFLR